MQYNDIINSLDLKVLVNKKYFKNDKMYFECNVPIESKRCIYCNYEKNTAMIIGFQKLRTFLFEIRK